MSASLVLAALLSFSPECESTAGATWAETNPETHPLEVHVIGGNEKRQMFKDRIDGARMAFPNPISYFGADSFDVESSIWEEHSGIRAWAFIDVRRPSEIHVYLRDGRCREAFLYSPNVANGELDDVIVSEISNYLIDAFALLVDGGRIQIKGPDIWEVVDPLPPLPLEPPVEPELVEPELVEPELVEPEPELAPEGLARRPQLLGVTTEYGVAALGSRVFLHGPGLFVHMSVLQGPRVYFGGELGARAFPSTPVDSGPYQMTLWGGGLRLGIRALFWPNSRIGLLAQGGVGVELLRSRFESLPAESDSRGSPLGAMVLAHFALGSSVRMVRGRSEVRVGVALTVDVSGDYSYVDESTQTNEVQAIFSPWPLRPGISISLGWGLRRHQHSTPPSTTREETKR
ncbi:MAG: hypothetical protein KC431_26125 [Myxococcales bacterium]|nr:hypothetical protein [Myxococcales bacterium]